MGRAQVWLARHKGFDVLARDPLQWHGAKGRHEMVRDNVARDPL